MVETSKKWFIMSAGHIDGPYSMDEIDERSSELVEPLVWGRGLPDWLPPKEWKLALATLGSTLTEVIPFNDASWKFRHEDGERGPFSYQELLDALKTVKEMKGVEIQGPDNQVWTEVYNVQKIVDELGITRRSHQRVPIMGHLEFDSPKGPTQARIVSISEGGLALNDSAGLSTGQTFQATLKSPHLYAEIPCTCEVMYAGKGAAGLRFVHLPAEGHAAVIEYVNKFRDLGER